MIQRALIVLATLTFSFAATAADLSARFYPPEGAVAHPGSEGWLTLIVENRSPEERARIHVRITHDPAIQVLDVGHWAYLWECDKTPGLIECRNADFVIGSDGSLTLRVHTPSNPDGGDYLFNAEVTSSLEDADLSNNTATTTLHVIRQHIVSSTNDSGPGSLRKAIEGANGWCTQVRPCEIKFRFPEGSIPVIQPLSPLPPLTACGVLVGNRPAGYGERACIQVELNGRHVATGSGLELRLACQYPGMSLFGMAINGFPKDGVSITAPGAYVLNGFAIGTDAAGTRAIPNGQRGIAINAKAMVSIHESLIGGNVRSGIALFEGYARVSNSRIGIGHDGRDLGNGASGIFVAPSAWDLWVTDSIIANHPDFGLALAGRRVNISPTTVIKENIVDVDWMLDGPTPNRDDDQIPNTPRVLSARFDAVANVTRVTVALNAGETAPTNLQIRLYASDRVTIFGAANLEKLAASKWIEWKKPIAEPLAIDVPGDLRGKHVSAVTTYFTVQHWADAPSPEMYSTSETSTALRVE